MFSGAKLKGADLSEVNLIEADLRGIDLEYTNLYG
ncbi:MAG: pentapeptide repeat-containing protein, partial [Nitrososphaeraceae archaeon]